MSTIPSKPKNPDLDAQAVLLSWAVSGSLSLLLLPLAIGAFCSTLPRLVLALMLALSSMLTLACSGRMSGHAMADLGLLLPMLLLDLLLVVAFLVHVPCVFSVPLVLLLPLCALQNETGEFLRDRALQLIAGVRPWSQRNPACAATLSTWAGSSLTSVLLIYLSGAASYSVLPRLVLYMLLIASFNLSAAVWWAMFGRKFILGSILFQDHEKGTLETLGCVCALVARSILALDPWVRERPVCAAVTLTWTASSGASVFLLYLSGAAFYSPVPRIFLSALLVGCFNLTLAVWWCLYGHELIFRKAAPQNANAQLGRSSLTPSLKDIASTKVELEPKDTSWRMSSHAQSTVRVAALGASGGALVLGTGGGALGLGAGGLLGATVGVVPAIFTFGLSIPICAALGSGLGCAAGSAMGGAAGAMGGGAAGVAYAHYNKAK